MKSVKNFKNFITVLAFFVLMSSGANSTEECFEKASRTVFKFNMILDDAIIEPLAKGYNKIVLEIDGMLTKDIVERQNGSRFLTKIEHELITLKTGGMKVPSDIWKNIRRAFLAGDLDFQKIENDPETPFITKATIRRKTIADVAAVTESSSSTDSGPNEQSVNVVETTLDIPEETEDQMPKFELNIGSDPVSKNLEKAMFDFQMSRFGPT